MKIAHKGPCPYSNTTLSSDRQFKGRCSWSPMYMPVCGSDGKTYANVEALQCKNVINPELSKFYFIFPPVILNFINFNKFIKFIKMIYFITFKFINKMYKFYYKIIQSFNDKKLTLSFFERLGVGLSHVISNVIFSHREIY